MRLKIAIMKFTHMQKNWKQLNIWHNIRSQVTPQQLAKNLMFPSGLLGV
jgi:hypothetical protein